MVEEINFEKPYCELREVGFEVVFITESGTTLPIVFLDGEPFIYGEQTDSLPDGEFTAMHNSLFGVDFEIYRAKNGQLYIQEGIMLDATVIYRHLIPAQGYCAYALKELLPHLRKRILDPFYNLAEVIRKKDLNVNLVKPGVLLPKEIPVNCMACIAERVTIKGTAVVHVPFHSPTPKTKNFVVVYEERDIGSSMYSWYENGIKGIRRLLKEQLGVRWLHNISPAIGNKTTIVFPIGNGRYVEYEYKAFRGNNNITIVWFYQPGHKSKTLQSFFDRLLVRV